MNNFKRDVRIRRRKKTTMIKKNSPEKITIDDYSIIMKHLDKWDKEIEEMFGV